MGIHALLMALVLARKTLPAKEKVKQIFNLICYQIAPNKIQKSEVQYIFFLAYNWIWETTRFRLTTSTVQEAVEKQLFD